MKSSLKELFQSVLSRPTAPFRESWVMATLQIECYRRQIPTYEDSHGNLWIGVKNAAEAKKCTMAFVAHTDHPGFIIESFSKKSNRLIAKAKWLGGGPTLEKSLKNFPVKIFSHFHGQMIWDGQILNLTQGNRSIDKAEIEIFSTQGFSKSVSNKSLQSLGPWGACLWFDDGPVSFKRDFLFSKAVDDLVGVCLLLEAFTLAQPKNIACIFSRAEESGFHGVLGILQKKILDPKKTAIMSIETSRELPGADCGKGPVVRLGDRTSVFDPGFIQWQDSQAKNLKNRHPDFLYQKRIMDGGSCEASAFNAWGFKVAGLSIPLKGYHNVGEHFEPVLESVNLNDCFHGVVFLEELFRQSKNFNADTLSEKGFELFRKNVLKNFHQEKKYF